MSHPTINASETTNNVDIDAQECTLLSPGAPLAATPTLAAAGGAALAGAAFAGGYAVEEAADG